MKKFIPPSERKGDVYQLIFADGKSYVGASLKRAEDRFKEHRLEVKRGKTSPVYLAWRKYGKPTLVILVEGLEANLLWGTEQKFIQQLNTMIPNGYNKQPGNQKGPNRVGHKHTAETKEKIRQAGIGRKHTKKSKQKMRKAALGHITTLETREKIGRANLGHGLGCKLSEEHKEKMRVGWRRRNNKLKKGKDTCQMNSLYQTVF